MAEPFHIVKQVVEVCVQAEFDDGVKPHEVVAGLGLIGLDNRHVPMLPLRLSQLASRRILLLQYADPASATNGVSGGVGPDLAIEQRIEASMEPVFGVAKVWVDVEC